MNIHGNNTILITGGGSGIGRALAEQFHALGNQVIITGRGAQRLEETTAANPGMVSLTADVADPESIQKLAERVTADYPKLNVLINMAGIMKPENLLDQNETLQDAEATVAINLLGPIRLTAALLPTLLKQSSATIINVTSGLAFVPLILTPTYSATKAAIHSYTQSLRYQLKDTPVEVLELIPPYVATTLQGEHQSNDPNAMPLDDYIAEVMENLSAVPTPSEILVKRVLPLRNAADQGQEKYEEFFQNMNAARIAGAKKE